MPRSRRSACARRDSKTLASISASRSKPTCNASNPTAYAPLTGSIGTHDPNVTADASCNFYEFATGQIGPQKKSTDLVAWSSTSAPATSAAASGAQIWAADATFVNGQFFV